MEAELVCSREALEEALAAIDDMKGILADTARILDQKNAEVLMNPVSYTIYLCNLGVHCV